MDDRIKKGQEHAHYENVVDCTNVLDAEKICEQGVPGLEFFLRELSRGSKMHESDCSQSLIRGIGDK